MKQNNLSKYFILSDVDGTIVEAPDPIPKRNIEALIRFTAAGGHFGLATGRSVDAAMQYVKQLPINAPCILYNGAAIYDFERNKFLHANYLPDTFHYYLATLQKTFPKAGIAVLAESFYASISDRTYIDQYLGIESVQCPHLALNEIKFPCLKVILVLPKDELLEIESFIEAQNWNDVSFVRSSLTFYEMLPLNTNKGTCLHTYASMANIQMQQIVAIGDYYNDEVMLRNAGIPVTVQNAPADIKSICQYVTGPCATGALADLIDYLEKL